MGLVWARVFFILDVLIVALPFTGLVYFMDFRIWIPCFLSILILSSFSTTDYQERQNADQVKA